MRKKLQLKHLKQIAEQAKVEYKLESQLRNVLSKQDIHILLQGNIDEITGRLNEKLQVDLYKYGKSSIKLPVSLLKNLSKHNSTNARIIAAKLLPENLAKNLKNDKSRDVRISYASRAPIGVIVEMCKKYPKDDQLIEIKNNKLDELSLDNCVSGQAIVNSKFEENQLELTDHWYELQARKLLEDYGEFTVTPIFVEKHWNPTAVNKYCQALKASYQIEIDIEKLQSAVDNYLQSLDKSRVEYNGSLTEIKSYLQNQLKYENSLDESIIFEFSDQEKDFAQNLYETQCSNNEYIKLFESMFRIKKSCVPRAVRNYYLNEDSVRSVELPAQGYVLENAAIENVENAISRYVSSWNHKHSNLNIPLKIDWDYNPRSNKILFSLEVI
jgi:hypothetical protein